jgi:hypothetical protein
MRRSDHEAELASNEAQLVKARAKAAKNAATAKRAKQASLAASGRVHYSFPGPPRGVDSPAEIEAVVGKDGHAYGVPRGQKLRLDLHAVIEPERLAACKALMVHGGGSESAASIDGLETYKEGMVALLAACTSLEELHWHDAMAISHVLCGPGDEPVASRLTCSLKVLSIPFCSRCFAPEDLGDLAIFTNLERLDLRSSLELEHGIGNPKCYRDPYDSDEDGANDEPMPYTNGLIAVANANTKTLREVDLDGILDFDGLKYCLDQDALTILSRAGVHVKLGKKTAW